ncbi:MAG TPA: MmgE/PrpD family protein, partial [Candidatus Binatia bacterium]|nr:MmgE/PrpD family protein [Candidatus Binatia bacterium]
MSTPPPVTHTFARFVAKTDYSDISDQALVQAKLHILDALGVALAAVVTPVASIAVDYCKRAGGGPEATLWGSHAKLSVPTAAFANGLLAHAL